MHSVLLSSSFTVELTYCSRHLSPRSFHLLSSFHLSSLTYPLLKRLKLSSDALQPLPLLALLHFPSPLSDYQALETGVGVSDEAQLLLDALAKTYVLFLTQVHNTLKYSSHEPSSGLTCTESRGEMFLII